MPLNDGLKRWFTDQASQNPMGQVTFAANDLVMIE
jgi:hypothetical protein